MPNRSREKGSRFEREIVEIFKEHHLPAWRMPWSGMMAHYKGDVKVKVTWEDDALTGECKVKANGFKFIYDSLGEHDFLAIKADRKEPLIVIRANKYAELIQ